MQVFRYVRSLLSLFATLTVTHAETIHITNGEWQPFMSQYSYHYGINSHVVSEAFRVEGIDIRWDFFPWKRAYVNAQKCKDWHASATWWPSEQTMQHFLISDPISNTSFVFFHLKTREFSWQSFEDLTGLTIGATNEYDYGNAFMQLSTNAQNRIEWVASDEINYKKLARGRIDIFPNDPIVGYAQIRNTLPPAQATSITHHPKTFEATTLHLIVSKQCANAQYLIDKFNQGFHTLKHNGRFQEMLRDLDDGRYDKQDTMWSQ